MGVPTSEVGYTPAMPRREEHEVHKDMWWHWVGGGTCGGIGEKKLFIPILYIIMRFVITVVFYEITHVQCVYWSNTTIFIGRI